MIPLFFCILVRMSLLGHLNPRRELPLHFPHSVSLILLGTHIIGTSRSSIYLLDISFWIDHFPSLDKIVSASII